MTSQLTTQTSYCVRQVLLYKTYMHVAVTSVSVVAIGTVVEDVWRRDGTLTSPRAHLTEVVVGGGVWTALSNLHLQCTHRERALLMGMWRYIRLNLEMLLKIEQNNRGTVKECN